MRLALRDQARDAAKASLDPVTTVDQRISSTERLPALWTLAIPYHRAELLGRSGLPHTARNPRHIAFLTRRAWPGEYKFVALRSKPCATIASWRTRYQGLNNVAGIRCYWKTTKMDEGAKSNYEGACRVLTSRRPSTGVTGEDC